ncbi:ferritin-like domain-containing protein [Clostridium botulinum]|nr:ferritin-like domain-containing protein [Clostridium botulinum]
MSYTTNRQPQGILKNIETFFREGMIAEIVAINDYSYFISLTDNKEVKDIFHHIMEEEKRHYGLFLQALRSVDKEQAAAKAEVDEHLEISSKEKYKEYNGRGSKSNLLTHIRDAIKGELEAIVLYEFFIENLENEKAIELIKEIIKDEKEHVEELTKALTILDKDKYDDI